MVTPWTSLPLALGRAHHPQARQLEGRRTDERPARSPRLCPVLRQVRRLDGLTEHQRRQGSQNDGHHNLERIKHSTVDQTHPVMAFTAADGQQSVNEHDGEQTEPQQTRYLEWSIVLTGVANGNVKAESLSSAEEHKEG